MAPLAFAFATRDMLESILRNPTPDAGVVAYLDDVTVLLLREQTLHAWKIVGEEWHMAGLTLNLAKCAAWAAQTARAQSKLVGASVRDAQLAASLPDRLHRMGGSARHPPGSQCALIAATRTAVQGAQNQEEAGGGPLTGSAEGGVPQRDAPAPKSRGGASIGRGGAGQGRASGSERMAGLGRKLLT